MPWSLVKIDADVLLAMRPHIAGHVNGAPTALSGAENKRLIAEGEGIALQIAHAGNQPSAIEIVDGALAAGAFERVLIATDTPTGSGVISLGMLRQMAELASLSEMSARQAVSAATGKVGAVYGVDVRIPVAVLPQCRIVERRMGQPRCNARCNVARQAALRLRAGTRKRGPPVVAYAATVGPTGTPAGDSATTWVDAI